MITGGNRLIYPLRNGDHAAVPDSVPIHDQPATFITLVLDVETGLMLGASPAATPEDATSAVFTSALAQAPPPLEPGPPGRVLCKAEDLALVDTQLGKLVQAAPSAEEIIPGKEAEGIFDQLVGHLSGRSPTN